MNIRALILCTFALSASAAFPKPPAGCKEKLDSYLAKIEGVRAEAEAEIDSAIDEALKNLKPGELEKIRSECLEWVAAWKATEVDDVEAMKTARRAAHKKSRELEALLEGIYLRDRADWDRATKAMEEKGYKFSVSNVRFAITFAKDLVKPQSGRGMQRLVKTLEICKPSKGKFGTHGTEIRVSEKDDPALFASDYISIRAFAQAHVSKECQYDTDSELDFLRTRGALIEGVESNQNPAPAGALRK